MSRDQNHSLATWVYGRKIWKVTNYAAICCDHIDQESFIVFFLIRFTKANSVEVACNFFDQQSPVALEGIHRQECPPRNRGAVPRWIHRVYHEALNWGPKLGI
jgi:hypothetical protein